jgi:cephalosporin hydroxylase
MLTADARALDQAIPSAMLASIERPLLVVEDSAQTFEATHAVLKFFDPALTTGDYIVVEDGIVAYLPADPYGRYENGPSRAIEQFLSEHPTTYVVDRELCDFFGVNVTYNPNGWLRRV